MSAMSALVVVVGITSRVHPPRSRSRRAIQEFLARHGMTPYMPQLVRVRTVNPAHHYMPGVGWNWDAHTWAEVRRFRAPMLFHCSWYWYQARPRAWTWRTAEGRELSFLDSDVADLATFWRDCRASCLANGVADAWILVDEPPSPRKEGENPLRSMPSWTPQVEANVVKLVEACRLAEFPIAVSCPAPSQYRYWNQRLRPHRWLVGAKHRPRSFRHTPGFPPTDAELWLYNHPDLAATSALSAYQSGALQDLATRIRAYRRFTSITGYLHWSFDVPIGPQPIGKLEGESPIWNEHGLALLDALEELNA